MVSRFLLAVSLAATPTVLAGQVPTVASDTVAESLRGADDVTGIAHDAQARFERIRLRHAPLTFSGGGGYCDEQVGRFCTTYQEGEWYPREEAAEIVRARMELLAELDSLQRLSPADGWILGQRVWYRGESGGWEGALGVARMCEADEAWWCFALRGLVLHALGRYGESLHEFDSSLALMAPDVARAWRVPERAVDRGVRGALEDAEEAGPDSLSAALATLWTLADPLYLVEGNDRLTAHYARWTVSNLRDGSANPYGMRWSDDLEELTVRHGWELGWERTVGSLTVGREGALGHKHPEGRDYMPAGRALRDPSSARAEDLAAGRRQPRSLYAPPYAPVLLPLETEVAVFPRGDHAMFVATPFLPEDTTFHSKHDHPRPWLDAGDQADMADRIGLFALPLAGGEPIGSTGTGSSEGVLVLDVPAGDYVLSVESWAPRLRRAGRARMGIRIGPAPADVATASDLLLLRGADSPPGSLEEALPLVFLRPRIGPGEPLAVAWEISGLGFRPETLQYALSVERTDRNVLRRVGEFFRLATPSRPLELAWQEPAPDRPKPSSATWLWTYPRWTPATTKSP